mmetsp:Transcript_4326/g.13685  ORF Transcript_4326/g.13685 Transcript_4326/m.13685 type:complete len:295 (+) Transcript_4326:127-1011(+)
MQSHNTCARATATPATAAHYHAFDGRGRADHRARRALGAERRVREDDGDAGVRGPRRRRGRLRAAVAVVRRQHRAVLDGADGLSRRRAVGLGRTRETRGRHAGRGVVPRNQTQLRGEPPAPRRGGRGARGRRGRRGRARVHARLRDRRRHGRLGRVRRDGRGPRRVGRPRRGARGHLPRGRGGLRRRRRRVRRGRAGRLQGVAGHARRPRHGVEAVRRRRRRVGDRADAPRARDARGVGDVAERPGGGDDAAPRVGKIRLLQALRLARAARQRGVRRVGGPRDAVHRRAGHLRL